MNGAESLLRTLVAAGIDTCFGNPGTSEMHFVAALDRVPGLRAILCLDESVVAGAADGYGRMAGKSAATLLHLAPGLGNAWSNLHNARRADTPILNIIGDHARHHLQYDAPLTADLPALARTISHWSHTVTSSCNAASDAARAAAAAGSAPGQIATLILPADCAWNEAAAPSPPLPPAPAAPPSNAAIDTAAQLLRAAKSPALLLRGAALLEPGLDAAGRIAEATGAKLLCDTFVPRLARGAGCVPVERLPYFAEQITDFLAGTDLLILVAANPPVAFFAYPGKPSDCTPHDARIHTLAHPHENAPAALDALADALHAPKSPQRRAPLQKPALPSGPLNQATAGMAIAALLPDQAILIDEAATNGLAPYAFTANAAPHDYLGLTGGSIGWGLSAATGAAVACPDRKILCLHGDGGAMYAPAALWTQARENLDIVNIIFANRSYAILNLELARVGAGVGGSHARAMLDIANPTLSFTDIARGMGVHATRAETADAFSQQLAHAMQTPGPHLIEAAV